MSWMADVAVKSTIVLGAAWLASAVLRRWSAAARHMVWCAAVAALVLLPLMTATLPSWKLSVPAALELGGGTVFRAAVTGATAAGGATAPAADATFVPRAPGSAPFVLRWDRILLWTWAAGAAIGLIHLLAGLAAVAILRRKSRPLSGAGWEQLLAEAAEAIGVDRAVELRENGADVPMTAGILHPVVFLPADAQEWDEARRRVVLLHELAHVRRHDALTWLAARLGLCVYWFHPLAWMAARAILRERERASDDMVLAAGARPSEYAGHLLEIATTLRAPVAAWAAACMARRSQLEGRLTAILDARTRRGTVRPAMAAAAALAAISIVAPLAAMRPQAESAVAPATAAEMEALIRNALVQRDHEALDRAAAALMARHKFDDAARVSSAALDVRATRYGMQSLEYAQGLVNEGRVLRAAGKWKQARELYSRALAIQEAAGKPDPATLSFLAVSALSEKQYDQAAQLYRRALDLHPDQPERSRLFAAYGMVQEKLGDNPGALESFRAALREAEPGTIDAATAAELLARRLTEQGQTEEAAALSARAREIRAAAVRAGNRPSPAAEPAAKVGGGVEAPKVLTKVEPQYTEMARAAKHQGTSVLMIEIGPDGRVYRVDVKQGLGLGLDEKAAEAVRQWEFQPARLNGVPVAVKATVEINFRLM